MSLRSTLINQLFLPESFSRREQGYDSEADFICPQGFGRNTYSDKRVVAIVGTARENFGDDIATFEWLRSKGFDPGRPNRQLAARCILLTRPIPPYFDDVGVVQEYPLVYPVIGQWEVLYAMWAYEPDWYMKHRDEFTAIWPSPESYSSTHDMLRIAKDIAEGHCLRTPLIVAHPEHIPRCFFIASKVFGKPVVHTNDSEATPAWFDQRSVQYWTRGPKVWLLYEMLARLHHRLHGWM